MNKWINKSSLNLSIPEEVREAFDESREAFVGASADLFADVVELDEEKLCLRFQFQLQSCVVSPAFRRLKNHQGN